MDQEDPYNWEPQHCTKEQVQLGKTSIRLTAAVVDNQYHSGKVVSKPAFRYGTFTFRMEPPEGRFLPGYLDAAMPRDPHCTDAAGYRG